MSTPAVPHPFRVAAATTVVAVLAVGAVGALDLRHTDHPSRSTVPDVPTAPAHTGIRDFSRDATTSGGKVMLGP